MFCAKCGAENQDDNLFCGKCGAPLEKQETVETTNPEVNQQVVMQGNPNWEQKPVKKKGKKAAIIVAVLVLVIATLIVLLVINPFGNKVKTGFNINAYEGDLSWVEWYIEVNYGKDILDKVNIYEVEDAEEEMVLVKIPSNQGSEPTWLMFDYNASVRDWYLYNHDVTHLTSYGIVSDVNGISSEELKADGWDMYFNINTNEKGKVDSIVYRYGNSIDSCMWTYFKYSYDKYGRIDKIEYTDSYSSDYFEEQVVHGLITPKLSETYQYKYNKDGNLSEITCRFWGDDEGALVWYKYKYNGKDERIYCKQGEDDYDVGTMEVETFENGRPTKVHIIDTSFENYDVDITYNSDGTTSFSKIRL